MVEPTSQTDETNRPSSQETGVPDRLKSIRSPLKSNRWLAVAVLAAIAASAPAVWNWVELQRNPTDEAKRKFDASLDIVKTVATVAGGAVLYLNFKVASQNAEIAQKKLDQDVNKAKSDEKLAEARLKMERFNKAVEMLGKNDSIHVRLGGIYALESIAADSDKDAPDETYRLVLEVLTAFVRENAPYPPKEQGKTEKTQSQPTGADEETVEEIPPLPTDIQAVLTVLNRRVHRYKDWEQYPLDLRKTDLRRADLWKANFQQANLWRANLQNARLEEANLQNANLREANFQQANLWGANLQNARLEEANLQNAGFERANLQKAILKDANLRSAILREANFQQADLWGANPQKAILRGANLQEAYLREANFQEADLSRASLQNAYLREANLQEAVLNRANLQGAVLEGASFWDLDLPETALVEAKDNARVNLQSAKNWETAQYDPEIREWLGLLPENPPME